MSPCQHFSVVRIILVSAFLRCQYSSDMMIFMIGIRRAKLMPLESCISCLIPIPKETPEPATRNWSQNWSLFEDMGPVPAQIGRAFSGKDKTLQLQTVVARIVVQNVMARIVVLQNVGSAQVGRAFSDRQNVTT
jgi:hypothetical protein